MIVNLRGVISPDVKDAKEIILLNTILKHGYSDSGAAYMEWEPDPRHVEIITEMLGLKRATKSKELSSPGIKRTIDEVNNAVELDAEKAIIYRSICMRINYLAQDRPDIMFAAKELAKWMSKPSTLAWEMMKRCGRYLFH